MPFCTEGISLFEVFKEANLPPRKEVKNTIKPQCLIEMFPSLSVLSGKPGIVTLSNVRI